ARPFDADGRLQHHREGPLSPLQSLQQCAHALHAAHHLSGVALHEGVLPGYPASHGCIRMSHDFAQKLWPVTNLDVRVIVAHNDLAPVAFAPPKLLVRKPKPPDPATAGVGGTEGRDVVGAIVMAQVTLPENDAIDAAPQAEPVKPAPTDDPAKPVTPPAKA